ncbi:MAG: hypothetical protein JKY99_05225 [Rhizobiales bacterium]|nr:hypothetical protein [Hyphomicrobiales bacterium]
MMPPFARVIVARMARGVFVRCEFHQGFKNWVMTLGVFNILQIENTSLT